MECVPRKKNTEGKERPKATNPIGTGLKGVIVISYPTR
jgi:hypothetical protein